MACCPLCGEEVQVGTGGLQGLRQHQGKKKCLLNIEIKMKDEQNGKNLTLLSFLWHQDKGETTDARVTREAASSSCIMVGPSVANQLPGSAARDDKTKAREEGGLLVFNPLSINISMSIEGPKKMMSFLLILSSNKICSCFFVKLPFSAWHFLFWKVGRGEATTH